MALSVLMRKKNIILLFVFILLIIVFNGSVHLLTDNWWFNSIDQGAVFWSIFNTKLIVFISSFIIFFLFLWVNMHFAFRFTKSRDTRSFEDISLPADKIMYIIGLAGIAVFSFLSASTSIGWWDTILKYMNRSEFGVSDPLFGLDIGFYFFEFPFYTGLKGWTLTLVIMSLMMVAFVYFLKGAMHFVKTWSNPYLSKVKFHLSFLLMLLVLNFALGFWFDRYELLYSDSGVVFGAGYTDANAGILASYVMSIITILSALLILSSVFWKKGIRLLFSAITLFGISFICFEVIYPTFQQKFTVEPE